MHSFISNIDAFFEVDKCNHLTKSVHFEVNECICWAISVHLALKNLNLKILDPHEDIFSNFFLIQ